MHMLLIALIAFAAPPASGPVLSGRPLAAWVADLSEADVLVREEALEVLARAGPVAREAVPQVEKLLHAEPVSLRLRAAVALSRINGNHGPLADVLAEFLRKTPGVAARLQALQRLHQLGPDGISAATAVLELTDHEDMNLRNQAQLTLVAMEPRVIPILATALKDPLLRTRRLAATSLSRMGPQAHEAAAALEGCLGDADASVRVRSARALWQVGVASKAVIEVLTQAMRGGDAELRNEVLDTVTWSQYAHRQPLARPILEVALHGSDLPSRMRAAAALYAIDGKAERVLPVLREGLHSPDRPVWTQAAVGLGKLGPRAAPAVGDLLDRLQSPEGAGSHEIHMALIQIGSAVIDPAVAVLKDPSSTPTAIQGATAPLVSLGPAAVKKVAPLLQHDNAQVRMSACQVLGNGGEATRPFVPKLTQCLQDDQILVRNAALQAFHRLGPIGREASPIVLKLAQDPQPFTRKQALEALEQMGADARSVRPVVQAALKDPMPMVRIQALSLLAAVDPGSAELTAAAQQLLKDATTHTQALQVIGRMGARAGPLTPTLVDLLRQEPNVFQRRQLATLLGQIGPPARDAVPELVAMLRDPDTFGRQAAVTALRSIGGKHPDLVPALIDALRAENQVYQRGLMIELLGEQGPAAAPAVDLLVEELKRPTWMQQIQAAAALARISPHRARKEGIPLLEKWLRKEESYRLLAASALCRIDPGHKEAMSVVRRALSDTTDRRALARQQAAEILAEVGPAAKETVPELRAALKAPQSAVRCSAAFALWRVSGESKESVAVLIDELASAQGVARQQIVQKLGQMGPAAKSAVGALLRLSEDPDRFLRNAVASAVRKIDPAAAARAGLP